MNKERDLSDVEINNISQEDTRMDNNPERLEMEDTGVWYKLWVGNGY